MERTTEFLVDELKCVSAAEAQDRVFFVSALEVCKMLLYFHFPLEHFLLLHQILIGADNNYIDFILDNEFLLLTMYK